MSLDDDGSGSVPPSRVFLIGIIFLLLFATFVLVRPFLGAIVLALLIGFLLQPLQRWLTRTLRSPSLAASIGTLLVAGALVAPFAFITIQLRDEAAVVVAFVQDPDGLLRAITELAAQFGINRAQAASYLQGALEAGATGIQGAIGPTLSKAIEIIAGLVMFFFLLFFTLRDGDAFMTGVKRLTPLRPQAREHLFALIGSRTRAIALGTFLVSVAQGVAAGIGWWFFGFPTPIFWAFVMTVVAVLPLGAPMLVIAPAGIIAIMQGNVFAGVGLLLYGAVVVGLLDNLLRPFVVGRGGDAHPAVILIGTLGGLVVFGVSGFLIGPLLLSLLRPVLEVWAEERRAEAGISPVS